MIRVWNCAFGFASLLLILCAMKFAPRASRQLGRENDTTKSVIKSSRQSPTECRNPRSRKLDKLSVLDGITLMLSEEATVPEKLLAKKNQIVRGIEMTVRALRRGGRVYYVGAGTSGRLGVLDASECPPTFRTPPEMVQGIIAGGTTALWKSIEGAEDDSDAGARAIESRNVQASDVVVGIAASGRTPFVWGALGEAKKRGAGTILICFNPYLRIPRALAPKLVICADLGPEVLTGSTRLKAGTATKLLLNMFTTLSMVRLGKVMENLMIDMKPSNEKLRDRAVRIVQDLGGVDYANAETELNRSGWRIKKAVANLKTQPPPRVSGSVRANNKPSRVRQGRS
jgi:N-acetylmuramic acid 6-phosphate etherase